MAGVLSLACAARIPAAAEGGEQGTLPAPAPGLAEKEKKEEPVQASPALAKKETADEAAHETLYVFLLASGQRITAAKYMDFGDTYALKDEQGQFHNIKKDEVRKILEPLRPPAKAEPTKPKAGAETAQTNPPPTPEAPKSVAQKPELAPKPPAPPATNPPAKNTTGVVFLLKDGRRERAFSYSMQGEYYVIQSTGGYVVKLKKSDVVKIAE